MLTKTFGAIICTGVVIATASTAVGQLQIFANTLSAQSETAQPILATKAPVTGASAFLSAGLTDLRLPSKTGTDADQPVIREASVTHALSRQTALSLLKARTSAPPMIVVAEPPLIGAKPASAPLEAQEQPAQTVAFLEKPQPVAAPTPVRFVQPRLLPVKSKKVPKQRWMIGVYR